LFGKGKETKSNGGQQEPEELGFTSAQTNQLIPQMTARLTESEKERRQISQMQGAFFLQPGTSSIKKWPP
jgi:hypothetical protein